MPLSYNSQFPPVDFTSSTHNNNITAASSINVDFPLFIGSGVDYDSNRLMLLLRNAWANDNDGEPNVTLDAFYSAVIKCNLNDIPPYYDVADTKSFLLHHYGPVDVGHESLDVNIPFRCQLMGINFIKNSENKLVNEVITTPLIVSVRVYNRYDEKIIEKIVDAGIFYITGDVEMKNSYEISNFKIDSLRFHNRHWDKGHPLRRQVILTF